MAPASIEPPGVVSKSAHNWEQIEYERSETLPMCAAHVTALLNSKRIVLLTIAKDAAVECRGEVFPHGAKHRKDGFEVPPSPIQV